jgi:sulfopyruvate decarboxylase TPP-binding subunit
MTPIVLTTEEEGVAACCGAWLGGEKSVLLMQSSGVGNCINMLSLLSNCNFPFVTIITMRGEFGEFNSWQVPMSSATKGSLRLMGLNVQRVEQKEEVGPTVNAALYSAYSSDQRIAVLLSQKLIGRKKW